MISHAIISKARHHLAAQAEMQEERIVLPLPPSVQDSADMEVYARFMRHLRYVPNSRAEIKVLASLQFTADMLDYSDAHIAKLLVELGLRAPRLAFPSEFLKFADQALMRERWAVGGPTEALLALKAHWDAVGDDKFAAFKGEYALLSEEAVV